MRREWKYDILEAIMGKLMEKKLALASSVGEGFPYLSGNLTLTFTPEQIYSADHVESQKQFIEDVLFEMGMSVNVWVKRFGE